MRNLIQTLMIWCLLSAVVLAATKSGTIITQVKGVPDKFTIRSSHNPAVQQRPNSDGSYSITVASLTSDYLIISPSVEDYNLYSPRIIPAAKAAVDTLYLIPPTNLAVTVNVDNRTDRDFEFVVDRAIVLNEMTTSAKDYALTVVPHSSRATTILIAALTPGFPAVVKTMNIVQAQRIAYLVILPQDIGLAPAPSLPPVAETLPPKRNETAQQNPPVIVDTTPTLVAPPQNETRAAAEPVTEIEVRRPVEEEIKRAEPEVEIVPPAVGMTPPQVQTIGNPGAQQIEATRASYYFTNGLVIKDGRNGALVFGGDILSSPNTNPGAQIFAYGLSFYNIKILTSYFDVSLRTLSSDEYGDIYYSTGITWHQTPFSSIDVTVNSVPNDNWLTQYNLATTTVGVNGYLKTGGESWQLGGGVRFRVDNGDFRAHFPEEADNKFRFLPSFYLLGLKKMGGVTLAAAGGVVDQSLYVSLNCLLWRQLNMSYTFKNKSLETSQLTPLESELYHKIAASVRFNIWRRD